MRTARVVYPGILHHVRARLVDRRFILDLDGARAKYLELLGRALDGTDWQCLAYALMSNHVHLLLLAGLASLESWVKRVHSPFALWFNKTHEGLGPIFADRPALNLVPSGDVARVIAYIHNNPVRAGVVARAADSSWTSHAAYLGHAPVPPWLAVSEGLRHSGFPNVDDFAAWVDGYRSTYEFVDEAERRARRAERVAHRRGAIEVGTPSEGACGHVPLVVRGRVRHDAKDIIAVVSQVTGVATQAICSRRSQGYAARQLVIAAGAAVGLTAAELSRALGITRQAGSRIARARVPDTEELVVVRKRLARLAG